ncbi:MAG: arsenate reductase family protein [Chromatocurvus sp.]
MSKPSPEDELIAAMSSNPVLIERPIAISGDGAVAGRAPDSILALLS